LILFDSARTLGYVVAEILFNALFHSVVQVARADNVEIQPIFNFYYNDGAAMVTVGVMLANAADRATLEASNLQWFPYVKGWEQVEIDVPPLMQKEKSARDGLLPDSVTPPTDQILRNNFNFELPPSQLAAYRRYYKYYPGLFGAIWMTTTGGSWQLQSSQIW
jgi:hypothetical protein